MTSVPKKEKIRKRLVLTFGAWVYALLFALGSQMEQYGATQPGETIKRLLPAFCVAFGVLWVLLEKILPRHSDREKAAEKPLSDGPRVFADRCLLRADFSDLLSGYVCL